jgi:Family of unknown function (DUF6165)
MKSKKGSSAIGDHGNVVLAPIGIGELLDKITILEIKSERITDHTKLSNVFSELQFLRDAWSNASGAERGIQDLIRELKSTNETLWNIEDEIRVCERRGDFGSRFIELARSVYHENDKRAALKRKINEMAGSGIIEEKFFSAS